MSTAQLPKIGACDCDCLTDPTCGCGETCSSQ